MTTNSYLEYFLTLLGWLVNNGLWDVLVSTGLFALPMAFKVVGIWLKVREEGEDEGNKGMLSLPRIENALYGAFFVMIACCVPLIQVSLTTLEFDKTRAKTCGTWTPKAPDESGYNNIISSMDGESAAAPVWWVLVHKLSKGVTQAAVASIPCRPDLRQLRLSAAMKMIGSSQTDYQEEVIRRLVSPANLTVSHGGEVYNGYGGNADMTAMNAVSRITGTAGASVASLGAFPALDAMRQALPMVQAVMLMAIYIMVPLILAFAAYEFKTVITLTFVIFAVNFLTFWWELARWLDSWLLTALYSSDTHSRFNMMGFQNTSDDLIMNLVIGTMFIVLPTVWIGALSWAGVNIGVAISNASKEGTGSSHQAAQNGGNLVKGGISSFQAGMSKGMNK
ncbi:conjugal transfer protein TraG N-terminal domain-containing protein [Salmonella enterica]|nr:conjugal transfer protein TraG N-terminal domain-containing protein [Salmonella enterica]EJY2037249.1 conjugal transfer protein TraG N-terminal domain-containing protein [Salmonella enterica]ELV2240333.1 conjugal transfer protein TraG N-terminal domain-containing protein [Salmonella enterica]